MKRLSHPCELTWMAEAVEDGRIGATDRAVFERHASGCAVCAQQATELAQVRETFARVAAPETSNLDHHWQRRLLMAQAGGAGTWQRRRRWRFVQLATLSVFGVAMVALVTVWTLRNRQAASIIADERSGLPLYEVTGLRGAVWSEHHNGRFARVTLSEGSAAFHVHHLRPGQRFIVTLPDGEVEVRGTRFVIDIGSGRTRFVVVIDGKVALRQVGRRERLLGAGERWDDASAAATPGDVRDPPLIASDRLPGSVSAPVPQFELPSSAQRPRRRAHTSAAMKSGSHVNQSAHYVLGAAKPAASTGQTGNPKLSASEIPPESAPVANTPVGPNERRPAPTLFAQGVVAFRAGRYGDAETSWKVFLADFPNDPRSEDVAFLRAVGRARAGDKQTAGAMARDYLRLFPTGMRRREAEALSSAAPPSARP